MDTLSCNMLLGKIIGGQSEKYQKSHGMRNGKKKIQMDGTW